MGNLHRSLSDTNLYLIRSRSRAPELLNETANSKRLVKTHTFARNILHLRLNARNSEGLLVAIDIHCASGMMTVTAFVYATNSDSTVLMNEHVRNGLFGVSLLMQLTLVLL